jgi:beta-lactamase regulating signal transducer with metallopeptidase domain
MESLFLSLWNRGAAAGWLVLAVIILRLALKKAPKSARCLLWGLVGLRLICPFSIQSALSLIPSAETVPQTVLERDAFYVHSGVATLNIAVNEQLSDYYEAVSPPAGHTRSVLLLCAAVWITGMALMLLWALASWLRLRRRLAEAVPEGDGVWLCGQIDTPFLLGLLRPRIYLPEGLDGESRACVLAHERAHIRRRDHWVKPAAYLLLAVYWFQPLVWIAYVLLCRDIELACDERVARDLDPAGRRRYSQTLLQCSVSRGTIAACPLAFGEVGVKERVKNVLHYKKPAFWVTAAALLACAAAAVCFLTDPPAEKADGDPAAAPLAVREDAPVYTGGALLYEQMSLNYLPADGSYYARVQEIGGMLEITFSDGGTFSGKLAGQEPVDDMFLRAGLEQYANEIGLVGQLCPENSSAEGRVYFDGDQAFTVWQFSEADGGALLLGEGSIIPLRLYELIDLAEAFPDPEKGGFLWTANSRSALPISFSDSTDVRVTSGRLYRGSSYTGTDGTVYWSPYGEDGTIPADARLHYEMRLIGTRWTTAGDITLRPVSKIAGIFGETYALECQWSENVSLYPTCLGRSPDTGALTVSTRPGEDPGIHRITAASLWWLDDAQVADAMAAG